MKRCIDDLDPSTHRNLLCNDIFDLLFFAHIQQNIANYILIHFHFDLNTSNSRYSSRCVKRYMLEDRQQQSVQVEWLNIQYQRDSIYIHLSLYMYIDVSFFDLMKRSQHNILAHTLSLFELHLDYKTTCHFYLISSVTHKSCRLQ